MEQNYHYTTTAVMYALRLYKQANAQEQGTICNAAGLKGKLVLFAQLGFVLAHTESCLFNKHDFHPKETLLYVWPYLFMQELLRHCSPAESFMENSLKGREDMLTVAIYNSLLSLERTSGSMPSLVDVASWVRTAVYLTESQQ